MEVKSTTKFVRLSPKKARDVAREIQGLPVSSALDILAFTPKKAAFLINKTLKTAVADAEKNFALDADDLYIKEAVIGAGPTLKRYMPRARGSAGPILKRTSHIFITLAEAPEDAGAKPKKRHLSPKAEA
jgi:large subunit ribosomal protein L22